MPMEAITAPTRGVAHEAGIPNSAITLEMIVAAVNVQTEGRFFCPSTRRKNRPLVFLVFGLSGRKTVY